MDVDPYDDTRTSTDGKGGDASARLTAGATIGRYEVRGVLGAGGMGVVYRAFDPELGRELAIKVVTPGTTSGKAQDRLLDEARAMAKLRHAHIVPVFDVGSTAAGVYIVMPLYSGGTLHDWLHGQKRPWREVVERFVAAGQGLVAAHAAGLIHRDFKPKNVFLGDAGEPLVGDFGLAAPTASLPGDPTTSGTATTSTIAGTPAYMAPEQAAGAGGRRARRSVRVLHLVLGGPVRAAADRGRDPDRGPAGVRPTAARWARARGARLAAHGRGARVRGDARASLALDRRAPDPHRAAAAATHAGGDRRRGDVGTRGDGGPVHDPARPGGGAGSVRAADRAGCGDLEPSAAKPAGRDAGGRGSGAGRGHRRAGV
ncbi:MAG: serine/threonine protein kinase [Myxococcales bacterium]|nr:serine/threonine protein kinase [Myxococcales bacterium]